MKELNKVAVKDVTGGCRICEAIREFTKYNLS